MPLTDQSVLIAEYVKEYIETNQGVIGLSAVFFGDQNKIPVFPAACVFPGPKVRVLKGAPRKTEVSISIYIMIYTGSIIDTATNEFDAMKYGEAVETLLHQDEDLNNMIVHGYVTNIEPGIAYKDTSMIRAVRVNYEALTQKHLPSSIGGSP